MSKELVVSANRHETRVAVLEDDQVVEVYHQRENEYSLAGSIHKGRVTRVLPGMQSAFVDIGLGRDAFLYVSDFFEDNEEYDEIVSSVEDKVLKLDRTPVAQQAQVMAAPVTTPPAGAPEPEPRDSGTRQTRSDDFFVLPGESLAKYTRPGEEDMGEEAPAAVRADVPHKPPETVAAAVEEMETEAAPTAGLLVEEISAQTVPDGPAEEAPAARAATSVQPSPSDTEAD